MCVFDLGNLRSGAQPHYVQHQHQHQPAAPQQYNAQPQPQQPIPNYNINHLNNYAQYQSTTPNPRIHHPGN